ncbi:MAG TPA: response regulator, partial [Allocoleopsis sp.]
SPIETVVLPEYKPEESVLLGKILVAEDHNVNQMVIKQQLKKIGYDCDIVENGEKVLEILEKNNYNLILMDCQMPILDGYNTTKKIRKNPKTQDLIIIGLTAFAMTEDREKCLAAGMNDYLSKPCTIADLQQAIEQWI